MYQKAEEYDNEFKSGKYLFKYCKFDINAIQIITNKTLYFSSPDKLNDPLDSKFDLKIKNSQYFSKETKTVLKESISNLSEEIREYLRNVGSELGNITSQERLLKEYFTFIQNTYLGICCFSRTHSENLLWTHYADQAKGVCLVFDKEKLLESFQKNLKKSNYKIIHHPVSYRGVKKLIVRLYKNGEIGYSNQYLFSKTSHWKYEKEYRFVLEMRNKNDSLFYKTNRFSHFFDFDIECIKYIIEGQRMPPEHRNILNNLKNENVFKTELLEHKFDL